MTEGLENWLKPGFLTGLRGFLGLVQNFRTIVKDSIKKVRLPTDIM